MCGYIFKLPYESNAFYFTKDVSYFKRFLEGTADIVINEITTSKFSYTLNVEQQVLSGKLIKENDIKVEWVKFNEHDVKPTVADVKYAMNLIDYRVNLDKVKYCQNQEVKNCFIVFKVLGKDEYLFYAGLYIPEENLYVEQTGWENGVGKFPQMKRLVYTESGGWHPDDNPSVMPMYKNNHLTKPWMVIQTSESDVDQANLENIFDCCKDFLIKREEETK